MDAYLEKIYYDPDSAAAYSGSPEALRRVAVKDGKTYTSDQIRGWLLKQDAYTLHRPRRIRYKRFKTIASGLNDQSQCDLSDLKSLVKYNDNHRYILSCLDLLSRRASNVPLKAKTGKAVVEGLKQIFKTVPYPKLLQYDHGSEFGNVDVRNYLKEHHIKGFSTSDYVVKSALVERYIRTLKERLHRYFTRRGTYRWLDILPKITQAYNNSVHSATKVAPNSVDYTNQARVWRTLHSADLEELKKPKRTLRERGADTLRVGDLVRIASDKIVFVKGFRGLWSREVFVIRSINKTPRPTYILEDQKGEIITGKWYKQDIKKIDKSGDANYYGIDRVLRTKGTGKRKQFYIRWSGYSSKHDSWVKASDMKDL